jgi:hypothetical protein
MSATLPAGEYGVGRTLAHAGVYPKRRDLARMAEWQRLVDAGRNPSEAFAVVACDPILGIGRWRGQPKPTPDEVAQAMGRFLARVSPAHARRAQDECLSRAASAAPNVMARVIGMALDPIDPDAVDAGRLALAASSKVLEAAGVVGSKGGTVVNVAAVANASTGPSPHDLATTIASDPEASRLYRELLDRMEAAAAKRADQG